MGGETPYRVIPFITHTHYAINTGVTPAPVLGASKEKLMLTRKNEFEVIAKQIDDLYYSMAMLEQSDVVEIDLLSNSGKFSPYRIPGALLTNSMKDFLRQRMEEAVNNLKTSIAGMVTVYPIEVVPDPVPVPPPVVPAEPVPTPVEPAPAPVDVSVPTPDSGPVPQ